MNEYIVDIYGDFKGRFLVKAKDKNEAYEKVHEAITNIKESDSVKVMNTDFESLDVDIFPTDKDDE